MHTGEWVDFEQLWLAIFIESDVDATGVASAEDAKGAHAEVTQLRTQIFVAHGSVEFGAVAVGLLFLIAVDAASGGRKRCGAAGE